MLKCETFEKIKAMIGWNMTCLEKRGELVSI